MRSFGTEISKNRKPNTELSAEARAAIIQALEDNQSPSELAKKFRVNRSTIYDTKKRFQNHTTVKSRPRTGRPEKLSDTAKRYIDTLVRRNPSITLNELVASTPDDISKSTVRRVLKQGYHKPTPATTPKTTSQENQQQCPE